MTVVEKAAAEAPARALTAAEASRLAELEATVERGFRYAGLALREIRDARLYRTRFSTWDGYCRKRWEMSGRQANRLVAAATVAEIVGPTGPINEAQARALAPLQDDEAAVLAAWRNARALAEELGRPLTARMVERAVRELVEFERRFTVSTTGGGQIVLFGRPGQPTGSLPGAAGASLRDGPKWEPVAAPRPIPFDGIPAALAASERNHRWRAENGFPPMPESAPMIEWRRRLAEGKPDELERIVARLRETRRGRSARQVARIDGAIADLEEALDGEPSGREAS